MSKQTVTDADQRHIAAQALKALDLRRQLDEGKLSHHEYLARLNALNAVSPENKRRTPPPIVETAAEKPRSSPSPPAPRPPVLMSALELLQLRRRLDNGELTRQEYQAQLHTGSDQSHVITEPPPATRAVAPAIDVPIARKREIVSAAPAPPRYMSMKCPVCTADLKIYDHTIEVQCGECAADVLVERDNLTISLRLLKADETDPGGYPDSSCAEELAQLQAEVSRLITVKRIAGVVGLFSTVLSACAGIADMAAQRTDTATSALISGCALLATIVCITRHTSKLRADLTTRIRALTPAQECD